MLRNLKIRNYALITSLDLNLESGFSVLTGETGAGKSILLGALGLVMGQRADSRSITQGEQKCVVEADFSVASYGLQEWFESQDLDYDDECVIRREVLASGKSRAFINDTPATLPQLRELCSHLIDIHSQHENLLLGADSFQLQVLDTLAHNSNVRNAYAQAYNKYKQTERQLAELQLQAQQGQEDADYLRFQFRQLDEARLQGNELPELEAELERLNHTEEIKTALLQVARGLENEEQSMVQALKVLSQAMHRIAPYIPEAQEMAERLQSAQLELDDLAATAEQLNERQEFDPQRLQEVTDRSDLLNSLLQKFHVADEQSLIEKREALDEQLKHIDNFDEELKQLQQQLSTNEKEMLARGKELTKTRQGTVKTLQQQLQTMLEQLGIPHPVFQVDITARKQAAVDGLDDVQFLFAANKNQPLRCIKDVASGGEISRVMLCIKALLAESQELPTLLLDEIDTGVSGSVADAMADIMQQMGQHLQLITITHLPQIAAKGQNHFYVYKQDTAERTETHIRLLSFDERIQQLAQMLSGSQVSPEAIQAAHALLKNQSSCNR